MQRITMTQMKGILKRMPEDKTLKILFTSSKTHLAGFKCWVVPVEIELTKNLDALEKTVNDFYNNNCNAEVGNSVHFYLKYGENDFPLFPRTTIYKSS